MGDNYYPQSGPKPPTLTVGDLLDQLALFDPTSPVIFKSPRTGAFGSLTSYSIDKVERAVMDRQEKHYPAATYQDDETGEEMHHEAYTAVFEHWSGVVIS